jgi:hypothetical protein
MARKTNYGFERREREKARAAKKAERQRAKQEKSDDRKDDDDPAQTVDGAPVQTADGQSYERAAIARWLAGHATSPATGPRWGFPLPNSRVCVPHYLEFVW